MKSDLIKNKIIGVLSVLSAALLVLSVINSVRIKNLERETEIKNQKYLSELCESLDEITTNLHKCLYTGTGDMLQKNGSDLYREASIAKVSLSGLTDESMITDEIYKFLSQVGDYTIYLSGRDKLALSEDERKGLRELYHYSRNLSEAFEELASDYYNGGVAFSQKLSTLMPDTEYEQISFSESFTDTQQTMGDYPTLLYDGPFADTVLNKKAQGVSGDEITAQEAREKAGKILGSEGKSLKQEADIDSVISLYCFSKGDRSIGITKKGGFVCYLTGEDYAGEATISHSEAVKRGKEYLKEIGFEENMTDTYYSTYDGICTVNYAYEKDGVIYYADLIKVSVSLETGEAVAVDSSGYLMNHTKRTYPEKILSAKECRKSVSPSLKVISTRQAVIPLETGKEAFCYEFHCKDEEGQEALIYVDMLTAQEKDIMLLLYSDDGVLTK